MAEFGAFDVVMLQDQAICRENFDRFIKRVKESREIWGLRSPKGWAFCPSNEHEGRDALVFWSDRAYAVRHAKDGWSSYEPTPIPLDAFIDRWLHGMRQDQVLVGLNWDAHLCGLEVEPEEVARKLTEI